MANLKNLRAKHKPSQHPHPLTFLMVHPLVIVEITLQMAWTKQIKRLRLVMVIKATINQSWLTLVHPNDPTNRFAESLYPFSLQLLE